MKVSVQRYSVSFRWMAGILFRVNTMASELKGFTYSSYCIVELQLRKMCLNAADSDIGLLGVSEDGYFVHVGASITIPFTLP